MKWSEFFAESGLPDNLVRKYTVVFNEHRIQPDMLKDLNKEILYDMGIKTIGDVIAILRHAKEVNEEDIKTKVLASEGGFGHKQQQANVEPKRSQIQSSSSVSGNNNSTSNSSAMATRGVKVTGTGNRISSNLARRLGPSDTQAANPGAKRSLVSYDTEFANTGSASKLRRAISPPQLSADLHPPYKVVSLPTASAFRTPQQQPGITQIGLSSANNAKPRIYERLGDFGLGSEAAEPPPRTVIGHRGSSMKATAMVRPTALVGSERTVLPTYLKTSVKDRLGAKPAASNGTVVTSNLRPKTNPLMASRPKMVNLRPKIFDRLGP